VPLRLLFVTVQTDVVSRRTLTTLVDIYTAGGEVLMGTMCWEKESAERMPYEVAEVAGQLKRVSLDAEETVLEIVV
jgi:circadian clock protein KaiC